MTQGRRAYGLEWPRSRSGPCGLTAGYRVAEGPGLGEVLGRNQHVISVFTV